MKDKKQLARGIRYTIGVTGHRDLRAEDFERLYESTRGVFMNLRKELPDRSFTLLSSLAIGADMLCAHAALAAGFALSVPLPFELNEYREDFQGATRAGFNKLLKKASSVFVVPFAEQPPMVMKRDFYYRQAGIYVARYSDTLIAFWDGSSASPGGCGTAETVQFAMEADTDVLHIVTPRVKNPEPDGAFSVRRLQDNQSQICAPCEPQHGKRY